MEDVYLPVSVDEKKKLKIEYELYKDNKYIDKDKVGVVRIYLKDDLIREENIYVKVNDRKELSWWEKLLRWLKW